MFRFIFMADMQIGAFATFSGMTEADVARYAEMDMRVHIGPRVEGHEWDAARYREAIALANSTRPDLVLVGGDMVDDPSSEDQYREFMEVTHSLDSDIPMRWVPGNHDIAADTVVPTRSSIAQYRDAFGPDYYAFDFGPIRFIALNTVVIDHPEQVPEEWTAQLAFLEAELHDADVAGRRAIILGHHPLFKHAPDEEDDYWNLPLERRSVILDLIRRHRVPLALAGHWHRNSIARDGDFEMVTTGAVGYPLGVDPSGLRLVAVDGGRIAHSYLPLGS